jgi:hypothetical protein
MHQLLTSNTVSCVVDIVTICAITERHCVIVPIVCRVTTICNLVVTVIVISQRFASEETDKDFLIVVVVGFMDII